MHAKIREGLKQITPVGAQMAILYGGSVKSLKMRLNWRHVQILMVPWWVVHP